MLEPFDDLADDNEIAFVQLQQEFKKEFDERTEEQNSNYSYFASEYRSKVLAAAEGLGIGYFNHFADIPESKWDDTFLRFQRDVDGFLIKLRIKHSRRIKYYSVGLSAEQKSKIHVLIGKIREEIQVSSSSVDKKEKLFEILADLAVEIDKDRSRLERFADLARVLSGVSKIGADGAEPWWKWFKAIMGVVDDAKTSEPQLPKPEETKRIEPPRREITKPDQIGMDDDIPF